MQFLILLDDFHLLHGFQRMSSGFHYTFEKMTFINNTMIPNKRPGFPKDDDGLQKGGS